MAFPRVTAAIIVLLLIGLLALAGIGFVNLVGPALRHGNNLEHDAGTIQKVYPNMDFDFKVSPGHVEHFQCSDRCRAMLSHMERHQLIGAHTDVYYVHEANNVLLAIDVD